MFHSFGVASAGGQAKAVPRLAKTGPLTFARQPRSFDDSGLVKIRWTNQPVSKPPKKPSTALMHETSTIDVWSLPAVNTRVSIFGIEMVPSVGGEIDYLMLTRRAKNTVFATAQAAGRKSRPSLVRSIRRLPVRAGNRLVKDHEAYAMEVVTTSGKRRVFFVNYSPGAKRVGKVSVKASVATWVPGKDDR